MAYERLKRNRYYDPPTEYAHSSRNHAEDLLAMKLNAPDVLRNHVDADDYAKFLTLLPRYRLTETAVSDMNRRIRDPSGGTTAVPMSPLIVFPPQPGTGNASRPTTG